MPAGSHCSLMKKFALYLRGKKFQIRSDHQALRWLRTFKEPEGQLARWQEMFADFDFEIVYRPGEKHSNADALSRIPMREIYSCAEYTANVFVKEAYASNSRLVVL